MSTPEWQNWIKQTWQQCWAHGNIAETNKIIQSSTHFVPNCANNSVDTLCIQKGWQICYKNPYYHNYIFTHFFKSHCSSQDWYFPPNICLNFFLAVLIIIICNLSIIMCSSFAFLTESLIETYASNLDRLQKSKIEKVNWSKMTVKSFLIATKISIFVFSLHQSKYTIMTKQTRFMILQIYSK